MRIKDAKVLCKLAKVQQHNAEGKITCITTPGSSGKSYDVIIRRKGGLSTECLCNTKNGQIACKGNSHSICYHCQTAIFRLVQENGYKVVATSTNRADILRRKNIGGKLLTVTSYQSGIKAYFLFEKNGKGE